MNTDDDLDDIWTFSSNVAWAPEETEPTLKVEQIYGVEPLGIQLGVDVPKTVPDLLYFSLFGQSEPSEAELAVEDDFSAKAPPLQTYAILDGAKIANLAEMLASSGLKHRCLFKGAAYDEMKDVAPWIVQIEEGNTFTRNLFTRSDAPFHMWDSEPGILIRSRGTLDDMWKHFCKFTRLPDTHGKWYFLRFWDPKIWIDALTLNGCDLARHLLSPSEGAHVDRLLACDTNNGSCLVIRLPNQIDHTNMHPVTKRLLTEEDVEILRIGMLRPFAREILTQILREDAAALDGLTQSEAEARILAIVMRLHAYGFLTVEILRELCLQDLFLGYEFELEDETGQLMQICRSDISETEKYGRIAQRISALELVKNV